jgi:hypothetical protein
MTDTNASPKRLTLNISAKAYEDLRSLAQHRGSTVTELVRLGLALIRTAINNDNRIIVSGKNGPKEIVFPDLRSLLNTAVETKQVDYPVLAKPAIGLTIGVFGETAEKGRPSKSRIEVVSSIAAAFAGHVIRNVEDLNKLSPEELEELIADRFGARGYVVKRAGSIFKADGGIDLVFWSKQGNEIPIQGAIQVKHHKKPTTPTDVKVVREMEAVLNHHRGLFNVGLVVTNTFFTADAQRWVRSPDLFLRLRDGKDVLRWVNGNFASHDEHREFPSSIELTSNFILELNRDESK